MIPPRLTCAEMDAAFIGRYATDWYRRVRNFYMEMYYRYLQAKRDYPFFEHPEPQTFGIFSPEAIREMQAECEREFNRDL
jgi:hypothetical protein